MKQKRVPKVRLARPSGRPMLLRYTDPETNREVRISTNTYDESEAQQQKQKLEAKLLLGIDAKPSARGRSYGPNMPWAEFRELYTRLKVATFRSENAMEAAEVRLDICEKVISPRTIGQLAKPETLARLQSELLVGAESPRGKARSAHTVRSYLTTLIAALNWAHSMKWLPSPVEFSKMEADEPDKGRPLVAEEFERMLAAVSKVVADLAAVPSWKFLLRGLWESGLRLSEAMHTAWDIDGQIRPEWPARGLPVLCIPSNMQKNRKAQDMPTTPAFAHLLESVPEAKRTGWVFNRAPRRKMKGRLTTEQVGRIITEIGENALIVVNADGKAALAHDLRRSFGQRLADAGLPVRDLQAIMRHSSITTTEAYYLRDRVQDQAARIAKYLGASASLNSANKAGQHATQALEK